MAYTKIIPIKENTHLQTAIDYIQAPEKTENKILISTYMCTTTLAATEFKAMANESKNKGNILAHHIIQAFADDDKITPEKAMRIGKELMSRMYPNHQYIIAVHTDTENIHTHILCNAYNFENHKKLVSDRKSLREMRNISDDLCRENGLFVITEKFSSHRHKLMRMIDQEIKNSSSFEDFLSRMQLNGYEVKMRKYLSFKGIDDERFMRTDTLGKAYTEKSIRKRIDGIAVKNAPKRIYDNKSIKISNKKRLKSMLDDVMNEAATYDEFLKILRLKGCEIREGKRLSIRLPSAKKNVRVETLGEEYTEEMLRLFFSDRQKYNGTLEEMRSGKIDRLSSADKEYNRYAAARDVNTEIKMLNLLSKEEISSYEELVLLVEKQQKQVDIGSKNIALLKSRIAEKKEVINAIRNYWRLKPLYQQYKAIGNITDREIFRIRNGEDIRKYEMTVEVMNKSKLPDGSLPKAVNLNNEIARIENQIEDISIRQEKAKNKLSTYQNIKDNADRILNAASEVSKDTPEHNSQNILRHETAR
ncbi:MAG: relaxase/mobilization nuclease domain-containing protein [Firmicutes bacterium]|nr:relaxase/mobilization nuclease domain-containing protein [Bacillota bacterium]